MNNTQADRRKEPGPEGQGKGRSGDDTAAEGYDWDDWVLVVRTRCEVSQATEEELRHARTPLVVARVSVAMHALLLAVPHSKEDR